MCVRMRQQSAPVILLYGHGDIRHRDYGAFVLLYNIIFCLFVAFFSSSYYYFAAFQNKTPELMILLRARRIL